MNCVDNLGMIIKGMQNRFRCSICAEEVGGWNDRVDSTFKRGKVKGNFSKPIC